MLIISSRSTSYPENVAHDKREKRGQGLGVVNEMTWTTGGGMQGWWAEKTG